MNKMSTLSQNVGKGDALPLISVVILNYKRLDALSQCLDTVVSQKYPSFEIIVVDNHSELDVRGLVESKGREIRLIELQKNLGTCGGRNAGIEQAKGSLIVTIDNDVNFYSPDELSHVAESFKNNSQADVIVFKICDSNGKMRLREWCHPRYWKDYEDKSFETYFLAEGACAFRREVFEKVGLYYQPFFIGHEGGDLAIRILDHGLRIIYAPEVIVCHLASEETRSSSRTIHLYTRNYIWLAYKDYAGFQMIRFIAPKMLMMLFHAVRSRHVYQYFRGIWDAIAGLRMVYRDRTPAKKETIYYVRQMERQRPSLRLRLERHREQSQI